MATFKVGQRVRIISGPASVQEGVVVELCPDEYTPQFFIHVSAPRQSYWGDPWICRADQLQPLTDPGADAFIESLKKLKPYEEPKRPMTPEELVERIMNSDSGPMWDHA